MKYEKYLCILLSLSVLIPQIVQADFIGLPSESVCVFSVERPEISRERGYISKDKQTCSLRYETRDRRGNAAKVIATSVDEYGTSMAYDTFNFTLAVVTGIFTFGMSTVQMASQLREENEDLKSHARSKCEKLEEYLQEKSCRKYSWARRFQ